MVGSCVTSTRERRTALLCVLSSFTTLRYDDFPSSASAKHPNELRSWARSLGMDEGRSFSTSYSLNNCFFFRSQGKKRQLKSAQRVRTYILSKLPWPLKRRTRHRFPNISLRVRLFDSKRRIMHIAACNIRTLAVWTWRGGSKIRNRSSLIETRQHPDFKSSAQMKVSRSAVQDRGELLLHTLEWTWSPARLA